MTFCAELTNSRDRSTLPRVWAGLLGLLILAAGLEASQVFAYARARPEKGHLIDGVPFEKWQARNFCGPACLAMVLRYWRGAESPGQAEIARTVYHKEEEISYNSDLVYYPRLKGMPGYSFGGDMETLKSLVLADIPVIVLTSMIKQLRKGHYRVVIGFDEARRQVIFHDPFFGPRRAMSYADFERNWDLGEDRNSKRWALVIVPEESRIPPGVRSDPLTSVNLATAYYRRRDYRQAALAWTEAREKLPGDPAPLFSLGMVYLRTNNYDRAIECARQAIQLEPRSAAAHDVLGLALASKGEIREGLGSLGRALQLDKKSSFIRRHYIQARDSYIAWSKTQSTSPKTQREVNHEN